jgi:hypothetical protein
MRLLLLACMLILSLVPVPGSVATAQTMLLTPKMLARVVHASPDAPPLDVYLDDIPIVSDTIFGTASRYLPLDAGDRIISIVPSGGSLEQQALAQATVTLEEGQFLLVLIQGYLNEITVSTTAVETTPQEEAGYARLRLIQAVPDVPLGDLLLPDGQVIFDDAVSLTSSSYEAFQAGQHQLSFRPVRPEGLADIPISIDLLPDISYDLIMLGDARTRSIRPLAVPTADDQACAQFLGIGDRQSGCLTIANASQDLGPVDIYMGEDPQLVASSLLFGAATAPIALGPASVEFRVVPSGGSPDDELVIESALAENGESLLMVLNGPADKISVDVYEDDRTPLAGSQSRIQVVHATDGVGIMDVTLSGTPLVQALLEAESSEARLVTSGEYRIEATASEDGRLIATSDPIEFEAGVGYRAVIVGDIDREVIVLVIGTPIPTDVALPAP